MSKMRFKENSTHFLNILRRVFSFELSSGVLSAIAAIDGALLEVSVDSVEAATDAGDDRFVEGPDEEDAIKIRRLSTRICCRVLRSRGQGLCCT
jgi:hypothetical protein